MRERVAHWQGDVVQRRRPDHCHNGGVRGGLRRAQRIGCLVADIADEFGVCASIREASGAYAVRFSA
ncbi:MAG: hypothetical protein JOZ65_12405 [Chloroflexi bacterium]|nr:hypothetical protein [Chloroflexota bacterium]